MLALFLEGKHLALLLLMLALLLEGKRLAFCLPCSLLPKLFLGGRMLYRKRSDQMHAVDINCFLVSVGFFVVAMLISEGK